MWCELVQALRLKEQPIPDHVLHMAIMECRWVEGRDIWPFAFTAPSDSAARAEAQILEGEPWDPKVRPLEAERREARWMDHQRNLALELAQAQLALRAEAEAAIAPCDSSNKPPHC